MWRRGGKWCGGISWFDSKQVGELIQMATLVEIKESGKVIAVPAIYLNSNV
jgi:hypothetical protein